MTDFSFEFKSCFTPNSRYQAGAAVTAAQLGLSTAISTVKAVSWGVMQNTSSTIDVLKDSAKNCMF